MTLLITMLLSDVFATLGTLLLVQGVLMAAWMGVASEHVAQWATRTSSATTSILPRDAIGLPDTSQPTPSDESVAQLCSKIQPEWEVVGTTAMICGVVVGFALLFGSAGGSASFAGTFSPLVTMIVAALTASLLPVAAEHIFSSRWRLGAVELREVSSLSSEPASETLPAQ